MQVELNNKYLLTLSPLITQDISNRVENHRFQHLVSIHGHFYRCDYYR